MKNLVGKEYLENMETRNFWCCLELIKKSFTGLYLGREVTLLFGMDWLRDNSCILPGKEHAAPD